VGIAAVRKTAASTLPATPGPAGPVAPSELGMSCAQESAI